MTYIIYTFQKTSLRIAIKVNRWLAKRSAANDNIEIYTNCLNRIEDLEYIYYELIKKK